MLSACPRISTQLVVPGIPPMDSPPRRHLSWLLSTWRSSGSLWRSSVNLIHACGHRCKLYMLERKCCTGVEKLKVLIGEHLQNGNPASDILEKTVSFFTVRKAPLTHNGYSRCTREFLRLSSTSDEDVAPLCL
ncbi:unnamed protein product [Merluccius merluccius]